MSKKVDKQLERRLAKVREKADFRENGRLRLAKDSPTYADFAIIALAVTEPTRTVLLGLVTEQERLGIVDEIILKISERDILTMSEVVAKPESAAWHDRFDTFVADWLRGSRAGEIALGKFIATCALHEAVEDTFDDIEQGALGGALLHGDKRLPTDPETRSLYRQYTSMLAGTNRRTGSILRAARRWAAVWTAHHGVLVDALTDTKHQLYPLFKQETLSRAE